MPPMSELPPDLSNAATLSKVSAQSERLEVLVKECAQALSSINVAIRQELDGSGQFGTVAQVLHESDAVARKMRGASEELSAVHRALEDEVRARILMDHLLAAAMEQEEGGRRAAFHDVLTGLPNRALFNNRLEHGFAQAGRHGWALAVMFVDLDDFKLINDSYGHDAGDGVLQVVAKRLTQSARGEDTVSRFGGDEFLCLLSGVRDEADIAAVAKKLLRAIQAPCPMHLADLDINPSVKASIGISIFPKDGTSVDALVKSADQAMYTAKRAKTGFAFAERADEREAATASR